MSEGIATAAPARSRIWLALELLLLTAAAAVVLALTLVSPPGRAAAPSFTTTVTGAQPVGAVVLAQEDKDLALALALQPGNKTLTLVATVLGQDGNGTSGLNVAFQTTTGDGATHNSTGQPCGPGCYAAAVDTGARPTTATVTVTGPGSSGTPLIFTLPAQWPPRPATNLIHATEHAYTRLKTLLTQERLASDPTHVLETTYKAVAPDKLEIASQNGTQSIIIGKTNWFRKAGQPWQRIPTSSIHAITPYWSGRLEDATLLGTATVGGRPTWVVSFAAPQFPAFFTIWIDKTTQRTLQLKMTAAAHFMHHTYGPFNQPITITPPR